MASIMAVGACRLVRLRSTFTCAPAVRTMAFATARSGFVFPSSSMCKLPSRVCFMSPSSPSFSCLPRVGVRCFTTSTSPASSSASGDLASHANLPKLKDQLRKLYLKIHPDFFESLPQAKETNQSGLATLNEFVEALETSTANRDSYELRFFVRENDVVKTDDDDDNDIDDENGANLNSEESKEPRLVQFCVRMKGFKNPNSPMARIQLHCQLQQLFEACGISGNFKWENESDQPTSTMMREIGTTFFSSQTMEAQLADLRRKADEILLRQNYVNKHNYLIRLRLRMNGVKVLIENEEHSNPEWVFKQLCRLHELVFGEPAPKDLFSNDINDQADHSSSSSESVSSSFTSSGTKPNWNGRLVVLSESASSSFVDARGRLVLSDREDIMTWAKHLTDSDSALRSANQHLSWMTINAKQLSVARALQLNDLYCEPALAADLQYDQFLDRLLESKQLFVDLFTAIPEYKSVAVRVHRLGITPSFSVDKLMGFLSVPVDCSPAKLRWVFECKGQEAVFVHQRYQNDFKAMESVSVRVKRKLQLLGLSRVPSLPPKHMIECCRRLLTLKPELVMLFKGMTVVVGNDFRCDQIGRLHIKWNWHE